MRVLFSSYMHTFRSLPTGYEQQLKHVPQEDRGILYLLQTGRLLALECHDFISLFKGLCICLLEKPTTRIHTVYMTYD